MHSHAAGVSHLCVVTSGRVHIIVGDKEFERGVGIYNLPVDVQHSITATEDGTTFINIF